MHQKGPVTIEDLGPREQEVLEALREVPDPEIPTLSVVDLGIIHAIRFESPQRLVVEFLPTFVGCPALDLIRTTIADRLAEFADEVVVKSTFLEQWSTDRISEEGKKKLKASGFAPPPRLQDVPEGMVRRSDCPYCGSKNTTLENAFGPTLCRAIHYCKDCRQPFEQFKPV